MKTKYFFFLALIILSFQSCKKEEEVLDSPISGSPDPCSDFQTTGVGQTEYLEDSVQFKFPTFNPQNQNEIIYNYINYVTSEKQLVKYNLLTKQKQILVDNIYLNSTPAWTNEGWIAFENIHGQMFKINSDGIGLVPFGVNEFNRAPSWSKLDSSLVWVNSNLQTNTASCLRKRSSQANVDTLISPMYKTPIVSNNNILLLASVDEYYYFDLKTANSFDFFQDNSQVPVSLSGLTLAMCWHTSKGMFYASKRPLNPSDDTFGLFEINYLTGGHRKIMDFCDSKHYTYISCSPDGNYLIGQRLDCYQKFNPNGTPTGEIVQNSSIYKIHIATGTETKINLD